MKTTMRRLSVLLVAIVMMIGMIIPATAFAADEEATGKDPVAGVTIPFGVYEPTETELLDSGRVKVLCEKVHVAHHIIAEITFTSTNYTEAKIGETVYPSYVDTAKGTSTFMLPVELNEPLTFNAHTTSMGGKDIDYTVTVKLDKDALKPAERSALQDGFYTTVINTDKAAYGWKLNKGVVQNGFSYPGKDYEFPVTVQIKDGKIADVEYTQDVYSIISYTGSDINYLMWAMNGHNVSDACYENKTVSNGNTYHISVVPAKNGKGLNEQFVGKDDISGIDTVSAATLTSRAIIEAVDQNLTKAERGQKDDPEPVLPTPDTSDDIIPEDGVYATKGSCIGASLDDKRPVIVTVKDKKISAQLYIQQRKATYPNIFSGTGDEALAAGEAGWLKAEEYDFGYKYLGTMYTGAAFKSMDKPQLFQMYASSSDTWFNRPITLDSNVLWDVTDRSKQDEFTNNTVYSTLGMFRIMDEGTTVTKSEDGAKYTVKIKIKPLASGNYDRIAIMNYPTGTDEKIIKELDLEAIEADKIEELNGPNGQTGELTTLYSPEFKFNIYADQLGQPIPFTYSQNGTWKKKQYFMVVMTDEEIAARKQAIAEEKQSARTGANTAAQEAETIDSSKYTDASFKAVTEALSALKETLANENATIEGLNTAKAALDDAVSKLEELQKNPMTVNAVKKTFKAKKLKKKAATFKAVTVKKQQGKLTYTGKGTNAKSKKALKFNKKNGKITVKKGTKKGTYKMTVTVKAAGNDKYLSGSNKVTVTVKVK